MEKAALLKERFSTEIKKAAQANGMLGEAGLTEGGRALFGYTPDMLPRPKNAPILSREEEALLEQEDAYSDMVLVAVRLVVEMTDEGCFRGTFESPVFVTHLTQLCELHGGVTP